jgi:hypothetical protein
MVDSNRVCCRMPLMFRKVHRFFPASVASSLNSSIGLRCGLSMPDLLVSGSVSLVNPSDGLNQLANLADRGQELSLRALLPGQLLRFEKILTRVITNSLSVFNST